MVGTKIDPGIGVDTGVAGDVLPQIAVSTAADIEARVAVVIAQLQGAAVFVTCPRVFRNRRLSDPVGKAGCRLASGVRR